MIRNRRPDWRRIKSKTSYTFDEAARALGIHRNTVRHWVKSGGLAAMTTVRPFLILGADLVQFLQARRKAARRSCGPGEFYCLKCRAPRTPVPGLTEYRPLSDRRGALIGMCSACETILRRFVSAARAVSVAAEFGVQITVDQKSLSDSATPALNYHLEASRAQ